MAIDASFLAAPLTPLTTSSPITAGINALVQGTEVKRQRERQVATDQRVEKQATRQGQLTDLQIQDIQNNIAIKGKIQSVKDYGSFLVRVNERVKSGDFAGARLLAIDRAGILNEQSKTDPSINPNNTLEIVQKLETDPTAAVKFIGGELSWATQIGAIPTQKQKQGLFSAVTKILPGDTTIQSDPSGEVIVKVGNKVVTGQERTDAIERSAKIESDKLDADAERRIETQRGIEQVKNAEKTAAEAFEMVDKIRLNIANLEEVTSLVGEGANTGPIVKYFPNFKAETIRLYQLQKRLGLDVVGSVRFGALSKGELDLALAVALPLTLRGDELIKWVNDTIAAKRKLATYLEDQAIFIGNGGTQSGWLEKQKADLESLLNAAGATEEDITQTMRENNMSRSQVLEELKRRVNSGGT